MIGSVEVEGHDSTFQELASAPLPLIFSPGDEVAPDVTCLLPSNKCFTITAEILARSLANFYRQ